MNNTITETIEGPIEKHIELSSKPPLLKNFQASIVNIAALIISSGKCNIAFTEDESTEPSEPSESNLIYLS